MLLSILTPTLNRRAHLYERVNTELHRQIMAGGYTEVVELLYSLDDGERSIGDKRNELVHRASGLFVCHVDDDDSIASDYVRLIMTAIVTHPDVDCIGITGIISWNGRNKRAFRHSVACDEYSQDKEGYYRPPNHLNPVRREIAARFPFPDKSKGEDTDWAMSLVEADALRYEAVVERPIYYYNYVHGKRY